uniref:Cholecystokinin 2 n=1 Tax=Ophionotus victoriae TaxID=667017 RepID=A0A220W0A6_9ECHI|nr:cholecystokinin 2 precursor [Ophionotus victoriae]
MDFKIPLLLVTLSYACVIFMTSSTDGIPLGDVFEQEVAEELGLYKPRPDRRQDRLLASLQNSGKSLDYGFGMGFGKRSPSLDRRATWRNTRQRLVELSGNN